MCESSQAILRVLLPVIFTQSKANKGLMSGLEGTQMLGEMQTQKGNDSRHTSRVFIHVIYIVK